MTCVLLRPTEIFDSGRRASNFALKKYSKSAILVYRS